MKVKNSNSSEASRGKVPGQPVILTDLEQRFYNHSLSITWQKPASQQHAVLYFSIRIKNNKLGKLTPWKDIDEIKAIKDIEEYTLVLRDLNWGVLYNIEIYAGNANGVGPPATGLIHRPNISYPEIYEVSGDKVGKHAIWANTETSLVCKAHGVPEPKITWQFEGKTIINNEEFTINKDSLTIVDARAKSHHGAFRCLASNFFGTVMSRIIQVEVKKTARFVHAKNRYTAKVIVINISGPRKVIFHCPKHTRSDPLPYYGWGYRDFKPFVKSSVRTSNRVAITTYGALVYDKFTKKDADEINGNGGARCIINTRTSEGNQEIISNPFKVNYTESGHQEPSRGLRLLERLPPKITVKLGDPVRLTCSVIGPENAQKWYKKWTVEFEGKTHKNYLNKFRYVASQTLEGRMKKAGTYRITCALFTQNFTTDKFTEKERAVMIVKVIQRSMDLKKFWLPREITAYESSNIELHLEHHVLCWYFNGKCKQLGAKKAKKQVFKLQRVTTDQSGVYQVDILIPQYGIVTLSTYLHVFHDVNESQITGVAGLEQKVEIVPPGFNNGQPYYYFLHDLLNPNTDSHLKNSGDIIPATITKTAMVIRGTVVVVRQPLEYSISRLIVFRPQRHPVNGGWSQWTSWSLCVRESCEQRNLRWRKRSCNNPSPRFNGRYCTGPEKEEATCPLIPCEKKALVLWLPWSAWSMCSKTCGKGTKLRSRQCYRAPSSKDSCQGLSTERKSCSTPCRKGPPTFWSPWSPCSKSCGKGKRIRYKPCDSFNKPCFHKKTQSCFIKPCDAIDLKNPPRKEDDSSFGTTVFLSVMLTILLTACLALSVGYVYQNYSKGQSMTEIKENIKEYIQQKVPMILKEPEKRTVDKKIYQKVPNLDLPDVDENQPLLGTSMQKPPPAKKRPPTRTHLQKQAASTPFDLGTYGENRKMRKNVEKSQTKPWNTKTVLSKNAGGHSPKKQ